MASANEIMAGFSSRHSPPRKRINWKKELQQQRNRVLDEAIDRLRQKIKSEGLPEQWRRGHYAAITELEIMKDE